MIELKNILKDEAAKLRELKASIKTTQKAGGIAGGMQWDLQKGRAWYRHRHIAYSLLKGKTYDQIENNCREGNEPDWSLIEEIKNEYAPEDVRTCA